MKRGRGQSCVAVYRHVIRMVFCLLFFLIGNSAAADKAIRWRLPRDASRVRRDELQENGACDGIEELVGRSGLIASPVFPNQYPPDSHCRWVVQTTTGWRLQLEAESFDVEYSEGCLWDYLAVLEEGIGERRFCGHGEVKYQSTSSRLEIVFNSDALDEDTGFMLRYTSLPSDGADKILSHTCNKTLTDAEGNITSPNYPHNYPADITCTYLIQGAPQETIRLEFHQFSVETYPCSFDKVSIYSAPSSVQPTAVLCGSAVPENIVATGSLYMVFQSDPSLESSGFAATYRLLGQSTTTASLPETTTTTAVTSSPRDGDLDCFLVVTESVGNVSSPGYPENYPRLKRCITVIRAAIPSAFDIKFEYVNIEFSPNCSYDRLLIWAENATSGGETLPHPSPHVLCGFHPEENVFSLIGTEVRLEFHTDASVQLKGFLAYYFVTALQNATTGEPVCQLQCQNNGTCYADTNHEVYPWRCFCPKDYTGDLCEVRPPDVCDNHLCENHGTCTVHLGRPVCLCPAGFTGDRCDATERKEVVSDDEIVFTKIPRNTTVAHGSTILLECAVSDPSVKVIWLHRDRLLLEEEYRGGLQVHPGGVLLIPEIEDEHSGKYTCMAMAAAGLAERSAWLNVVEPCQLRVVKAPKDAVIQEGSNIIFQCFVPEATVIWRKDGEILHLDKRKRMLVNNYLLIDRAVETDSGEYTCAARSISGCFAKTSANLTVKAIGHGIACGRPKTSAFDGTGRISSGREAPELSAPWHVIMQEKAHDTTFCGGSLISDRWLVTAAHCVTEFQENYGYPFVKESINLYVGTRHCRGEGGQHRRISRYILHPNFNASNFDNDIALFELDKPVIFSESVMPICLEKQLFVDELLKVGRVGVITGCGSLHEGGNSPLYLNEVKIPYVSRQLCGQRAGQVNASFTDHMLCAGYARSMRGDACNGDSGGPYSMEYHGRWVLVGLVSWGVGCDRQDQYGYYTHVSLYLNWIMSLTEGHAQLPESR